MAVKQTGLGWYADETWLANAAGEIGKITTGGADAGYGPYGVWYPNWKNSQSANPNGWYATKDADCSILILWFKTPGNENKRRTYVKTTSMGRTSVQVAWAETTGGPPSVSPFNANTDTFNELIYTSNNYKIFARTWAPGSGRVPYYSEYSIDSGYVGNNTSPLDEMAISAAEAAETTFAKSSAGYSVVCMCEWNAVEQGDTYISPVLISSEQNNTLYTRNSATPTIPTTEHLYQGMTFYMRKAPLDIFNPTATITTDYALVVLTNPSAAITNDEIFEAICLASGLGVGYPPQDPDPYGPGGTSEPGTSEGTFDETSDIIVDSNVPTYSFSGTGFSRIYNPNLAQLRSLASYLWTDTTFLQTIINHGKQLLENPMEAIISLSLLPCSIPHSTTDEEVKVMYVGTGVSMYPATTQFVDVDCGSLLIDKFYDSALDFNPYTTISLFLPFIGMVDLDADEVMGRYLQVKYRVDIISGACVAKVFVSDADGISYSCRYQFNGDCAVSMPLNSADFSGYRAAFIAAATAVTMGTMAAVGGAAGMTGAAIPEGVETSSAPGIAEATSTALTVVPRGGALQERVTPAFSEPSSNGGSIDSIYKIADVVAGPMANLVGSVMGGKMHFQHASGFGGNAGMLGIRRPFVVIKRPRMCNPEEYGVYNGRPCQMYLSLGTISGFTQVGNVHLTGIPATIPELNEIAGFLRSGVIL